MEISIFVNKLKSRNLMPANIQFSNWNDWHLVSCFDKASSCYISESVAMGVDKIESVAFLKALTEYCERRFSKESLDSAAKVTLRSDGFAAYPVDNISEVNSLKEARNNAFNEALERYLWANWWDNPCIGHKIENWDNADSDRLKNYFSLQSIKLITVVNPTWQKSLLILLAESTNKGYFTGGAAGSQDGISGTISRAFGELLRHLVVFQRMSKAVETELTFYEKRLFGFGSGKWNDKVQNRINSYGNQNIIVGKLLIDKIISHSNMDIVAVHRCLFENQPVFMGGDIGRLCI